MAKPRVLFINRSYWPDTEATGQLLTALCEDLSASFDVHVLAGQPNVCTTDEDWKSATIRNGVTIHRVQHARFSKRRLLLKAVNFVSFARACRKQVLRLPKPDVVVFETDPFLLPFVADHLQRRSGCRMIGYLQDIYPDVAVALKKVRNSLPVRILRQRMFDVYRRCDRMVVLSEDMRQLLLDADVSDECTRVIPNWADTQLIQPIHHAENRFRSRFSLQDKFVCMYSGNLGLTQRLEEFIAAAEILQDDPRIQFVFVGQGARRADLERQAAHAGLKNVLFCDYQPLEELSHSLSAADLHLLPLTAELSRCLMPSKLYGILAAGRPYLTTAPDESELCRLTVEHGVGFKVPAGDPLAIANAIRRSGLQTEQLQAMGRAARKLAEQKYSRGHAVEAFKKLLMEVA